MAGLSFAQSSIQLERKWRQVIGCPLRLYGDDAQYFKDRSCALLTMSSIRCRLPSWESRLLLTVVPLYAIVPDVTMPRIYDVLAWSFKVLLRGYWPATDPFGNSWPATCWRAGMAGKLLVPKRDGICIAGAVARVTGDWKWFKEAYELPQSYQHVSCCHLCKAVKDTGGDVCSAFDFRQDARWTRFIFIPLHHIIPSHTYIMRGGIIIA